MKSGDVGMSVDSRAAVEGAWEGREAGDHGARME
jgi:hypothetical protein